jgi:PAS domain S-box-containing protein
MRVLVGIPDPRSRRFLERVVRKRGHEVVSCATPEELAAARKAGGHRLALLAGELFLAEHAAEVAASAAGPARRREFVIAVADETDLGQCASLVEAGAHDVLVRQFDEALATARLAIAEESVRQAEAAERAHVALERRARQSQAVAELGRRVLDGLEVPALFEGALMAVSEGLGTEFVLIAETTPDGAELLIRAGIGWKPGLVGRSRISATGGSPSGVAARSGEPVVVDDLRRETRFRGAALLKEHGVVSGISVPIKGAGKPFGALSAFTQRLRAFRQDDVSFLRNVANVVGAAVARASTEEQLRASEERTRSVLESALDAVVAIDASGSVVFWNAGAEEIFARPRVEVIGRRLSDLVVPPRDREAYLRNLEMFLTTGEGPLLNRRLEGRALRGDGSEFPAEITVTPVRARDGFLFFAFVRDLSERIRSEKALRESERFSRRLVEATPHAAFVFDVVEKRLDFVSERSEAVVGWKAADLRALGTSVLERLLLPEDRARVPALRPTWEDVGDDDVAEAEVRVRDVRGAVRTIRASCKVFSRTEDGKVRQVVGTAEDVTRARRGEDERRLLEGRVREAQKAESLGVLAGGIAHDFNNLLTSVLGNAGLALLDLPPESPLRRNLAQIEAATRRAADLTNQLLAYAGKGRIANERIDVARLVEETATLARSAVSKDVRVLTRHGGDAPVVDGDPTQVRQVVLNLVTNAAEACGGRAGEVKICTGRVFVQPGEEVVGSGTGQPLAPGPYAFLEVSDTGCGMDPATMERIFDPFFSTKRTGRGLGLAAVLGVVRCHRGAITVKSEPGRGATFRVLLPGHESAPPVVKVPAPDASWRPKGTILLVDDEEDVRLVASHMLRSIGLETLEAADGPTAVRILKDRGDAISAVVLDLTMPLMDGAQTLAALRAIRPALRVLVSSGYADYDVRTRFARGERPTGFLHKPYDREQLRTAIREVLAG